MKEVFLSMKDEGSKELKENERKVFTKEEGNNIIEEKYNLLGKIMEIFTKERDCI